MSQATNFTFTSDWFKVIMMCNYKKDAITTLEAPSSLSKVPNISDVLYDSVILFFININPFIRCSNSSIADFKDVKA